MPVNEIPSSVCAVVGDVLGTHYYNHTTLNMLFMEHGAPGDTPPGNCVTKCTQWLKRANSDPMVDPFRVLGGVLQDFMEYEPASGSERLNSERERVHTILQRYGLSYRLGGRIAGAKAGPATQSLRELIAARDLSAVEAEFERALQSVNADPPAALTAACSLVEALCKVYIDDQGLNIPKDQTIKPLWAVVRRHLGLDPASLADDDLKRILGGLSAIVDGIGALRTHAGSAHGRGRKHYRIEPRHARLAIHAAHSLATFVIETWDARKRAGQ